MKLSITLLILLLIAIMPVAAWGQDYLVADTTMFNEITADMVSFSGLGDWTTTTAIWNSAPVKHDTTKEYAKEIADKCDTAWTKAWMPFEKIKGVQYFKRMAAIDSVHCYIDTVWAKKELIYFTPDEVEKLRELIKCH